MTSPEHEALFLWLPIQAKVMLILPDGTWFGSGFDFRESRSAEKPTNNYMNKFRAYQSTDQTRKTAEACQGNKTSSATDAEKSLSAPAKRQKYRILEIPRCFQPN